MKKLRLALLVFFISLLLSACENLEEIGAAATGQIVLTEEDYRQLTIEYFEARGYTCYLSSNSCSQVFSGDVDKPGDISSTITTYDLEKMEYKYSLLIVVGYGNIIQENTINLKTGNVSVSDQYYDLFNGLYNIGVAQKNMFTGQFEFSIDKSPQLFTTHTEQTLRSDISALESTMSNMTRYVYGLELNEFIYSDFNN